MRWILLAVLLTGCAGSVAPPTTAPEALPPATTAVVLDVPDELGRFPIAHIVIDGRSVPVAVADSRPLRVQGLRGVDDLGDLGGMLFVFDGPTQAAFTMRDTLIPLDLHHLDPTGRVLEIIPMEPCDGPTCSFPASVEFTYSLETRPGAFDLSVGDTVGIPSR